MPLIRISLRKGKSTEYVCIIADQIYEAMRETFDVPADDIFMIVNEHDDHQFIYSRDYMDIARSDDFVIIQMTVSNARTTEKKKALYARIAEKLSTSPGLRREDVFVNLVDVTKDNWSFGNGLAQYA